MNPKEAQNKAYAEAAKIDAQINALTVSYPPTDTEYKMFWFTFTRTIGTSLDIITKTIEYRGMIHEQSDSN